MKSCFSDLPVKDGTSGTWKLDTFEITADKAMSLALRAEYTGNTDEFIPPGRYRRLSNGWDVVMSNTPMEIRTCQDFLERATGRVLINGLGLGMVLHAILQKDDVTHVTVIEKEQDVINLVAASFANDPRVEIIHADAMMYCPPAGVTYNACWHDIWPDFATANSHRWISWKLSTGTSVNGRARGAGRSVSKSTLSFKILGLIEYNF
jgi:hypothetical protein